MEIVPIIEWVASQFPSIVGHVTARIGRCKRQFWSGYAYPARKWIRAAVRFDEYAKPIEQKVNGYRRFAHLPITPYTLHNPIEALVHVTAHEFAHCMGSNVRMRRSRQERHSEDMATTVLEAFRTPEAQAKIAQARRDMVAKSDWHIRKTLDARVFAASDECKMQKLFTAEKRWTRKAKLAATKLKKIQRAIKRLQLKVAP